MINSSVTSPDVQPSAAAWQIPERDALPLNALTVSRILPGSGLARAGALPGLSSGTSCLNPLSLSKTDRGDAVRSRRDQRRGFPASVPSLRRRAGSDRPWEPARGFDRFSPRRRLGGDGQQVVAAAATTATTRGRAEVHGVTEVGKRMSR